MLTGELKDSFERWFIDNHSKYDIDWFYSLSIPLQIGIYIQYLDSIDIFITDVFLHYDKPKWIWNLELDGNLYSNREEYNSRLSMYESAINYIDSTQI